MVTINTVVVTISPLRKIARNVDIYGIFIVQYATDVRHWRINEFMLVA